MSLEYMMYLHEGMYGVPMGPVVSEDPMIQDRWDLYRLFRGLDWAYRWNVRSFVGNVNA